jgi:hypothetical protein
MLTWLISAAVAASSSWNATCAAKDDASVWFVFAQAPDAPAQTDFDCKGLFFDTTVACPQTVGVGKIRGTGVSPTGHPQHELRYLPYGDLTSIVTFLNAPGGGVVYKAPTVAPTTYAGTPPPPKPAELLKLYLEQRAKASAPTKNITLHVWSCPDAQFFPPDEAIAPFGMKLAEHLGRLAPPTQ